ncbi:hypothetical protein K402DRAFT_390547 [Aulographum hederae CBS 113979]|uniref:DUF1989 domain-containing protein n=1 Tax=Aulographum hederae CBS 113979 TaxID=1176131 RepID=A0A6G1H952_9PEZI|nr:hypothetical protein K402DRAFT_390547 [Aulographum hederae CBS 113979]
MGDLQTIPARHGTATFVPKGQSIKIINTYGKQVVDTWAFALHAPPTEEERRQEREQMEQAKKQAEEEEKKAKEEEQKAKNDVGEKGEEGKEAADGAAKNAQKASGWSAYIPSVPYVTSSSTASTTPKKGSKPAKATDASKGWSSYIPSGKGFTNYLPTSKDVSAFAGSHYRDPDKSIAEQMYTFSKTPVGAGALSVATGSGYASSLYAAYSAYNPEPNIPPMEYLSMPHTRATTKHLSPRVGDALMTNLREPLMTLVEDTSRGLHDTLIAACDPARYRELGVDNWEEHGSCAENLVLALKEVNEKSGLKGPKAIGADVTVNMVPSPLNLFMNIPWTDKGDVSFEAPGGKKGEYIRLRAERDCVVVMSACPQDILAINGNKPMVAHFVVEESKDKAATGEQEKPKAARKPSMPATPDRKKSAPKLGRAPSSKSAVPSAQKKIEEGKEEAEKTGTDAAKKGEDVTKKAEEAPKTDGTPVKKKPKKLEKRTQ